MSGMKPPHKAKRESPGTLSIKKDERIKSPQSGKRKDHRSGPRSRGKKKEGKIWERTEPY